MQHRILTAGFLLALVLGGVAGGLAAGPAFLMPGIPYAQERISATTTTAVGITDTLCRVGGVSTGSETPALIQVVSNSIYYTIHSTTGTPVATDYLGAANDFIPVNVPSKFRAIGNSGTAVLVVTCFMR